MKQIEILNQWFTGLLNRHGKDLFSTFENYDPISRNLVLTKKTFQVHYGLFWVEPPSKNELIISWSACFDHPLIWNIDIMVYLAEKFQHPLPIPPSEYPFHPIPKEPAFWLINQDNWSMEEAFAHRRHDFIFSRLPPSRFGLTETLYHQKASYSKSFYLMIEQGDWPLILAGEHKWPWKDQEFLARCFCLFFDKGIKSSTLPSRIEDDIRMLEIFFSHHVDIYRNIPYEKEIDGKTIHYTQTPFERFSKRTDLHPYLIKKVLDYAPTIDPKVTLPESSKHPDPEVQSRMRVEDSEFQSRMRVEDFTLEARKWKLSWCLGLVVVPLVSLGGFWLIF